MPATNYAPELQNNDINAEAVLGQRPATPPTPRQEAANRMRDEMQKNGAEAAINAAATMETGKVDEAQSFIDAAFAGYSHKADIDSAAAGRNKILENGSGTLDTTELDRATRGVELALRSIPEVNAYLNTLGRPGSLAVENALQAILDKPEYRQQLHTLLKEGVDPTKLQELVTLARDRAEKEAAHTKLTTDLGAKTSELSTVTSEYASKDGAFKADYDPSTGAKARDLRDARGEVLLHEKALRQAEFDLQTKKDQIADVEASLRSEEGKTFPAPDPKKLVAINLN